MKGYGLKTTDRPVFDDFGSVCFVYCVEKLCTKRLSLYNNALNNASNNAEYAAYTEIETAAMQT